MTKAELREKIDLLCKQGNKITVDDLQTLVNKVSDSGKSDFFSWPQYTEYYLYGQIHGLVACMMESGVTRVNVGKLAVLIVQLSTKCGVDFREVTLEQLRLSLTDSMENEVSQNNAQ